MSALFARLNVSVNNVVRPVPEDEDVVGGVEGGILGVLVGVLGGLGRVVEGALGGVLGAGVVDVLSGLVVNETDSASTRPPEYRLCVKVNVLLPVFHAA